MDKPTHYAALPYSLVLQETNKYTYTATGLGAMDVTKSILDVTEHNTAKVNGHTENLQTGTAMPTLTLGMYTVSIESNWTRIALTTLTVERMVGT